MGNGLFAMGQNLLRQRCVNVPVRSWVGEQVKFAIYR
jgi:hypothetical protein